MQTVMKRGVAWIAAAVIALTVGVFASTSQAFAVEPSDADDVAITKDFVMATNVTCPDVTFTYTFTPQTVNGVAYEAGHDGGAISPATITYGSGDVSATVDRVKYADNLFNGVTFSHAGEYVYLVQETEPGTIPAGYEYNIDDASYFMHVYVENDGSGGLTINSVGVHKVKIESGKPVDGDKVEGDKPTNPGEMNGFIWKNSYSEPAKLTITKTTAGDYADLTKQFKLSTISLTLPFVPSDEVKAAYKITRADATTSTGEVTFDTAGKASITNIALANGDKVEFIDAGDDGTLPVGTTYEITESSDGTEGYTNYKPSAKVVYEGAETTVSGTYDFGDPITIDASTAADKNLVGSDDTSAANITNTYNNPTPTGILIDNLPWILLVCAAAAGLVVFVVSRRKKKVHVA